MNTRILAVLAGMVFLLAGVPAARAQPAGASHVYIVSLKPAAAAAATATPDRAAIRTALDAFIQAHASHGAGTFRVQWRGTYIPALAIEMDDAKAQEVGGDPNVAHMARQSVLAALAPPFDLDKSLNAYDAWQVGFSGAQTTIAIVDSGVDPSPLGVNGRQTHEACFSASSSASQIVGLCPLGQDTQTGTGAAWPQKCEALKLMTFTCDHGTAVAAVAARQVLLQNNLLGFGSGIAPYADLVAVQVFSEHLSAADCQEAGQTAPCVTASESDILAALEYLYANAAALNLSAVNLSLGSGAYGACDSAHPDVAKAINLLTQAGVGVVVAAGNDNITSGVAFPACIANAIAVGNVDQALTPYSNASGGSDSSDQIRFWAVGVDLGPLPLPNGVTSGLLTGTSFSSPQIAAAFAIIKRSAHPKDVATVLNMLAAGATMVTDNRNMVTRPLPNLLMANLTASGMGYARAPQATGFLIQKLQGTDDFKPAYLTLQNPGLNTLQWTVGPVPMSGPGPLIPSVVFSPTSGALPGHQAISIQIAPNPHLPGFDHDGVDLQNAAIVKITTGEPVVRDGTIMQQAYWGVRIVVGRDHANYSVSPGAIDVAYLGRRTYNSDDLDAGKKVVASVADTRIIATNLDVGYTKSVLCSQKSWQASAPPPPFTDCVSFSPGQYLSYVEPIDPAFAASHPPGDYRLDYLFGKGPSPDLTAVGPSVDVKVRVWSDLSPLTTTGGDFVFTGPRGGPFTPAFQDYTVTNPTDAPASVRIAASDVDWFDVDNAAMTIPAHGAATFRVRPNPQRILWAQGLAGDILILRTDLPAHGAAFHGARQDP